MEVQVATTAATGNTSNGPSTTSSSSTSTSVRPKAIVLLFGWLGSQPRYVKKYADVYHAMGCTTLHGTANGVDVMIRIESNLDHFAMQFVREAAKQLRAFTTTTTSTGAAADDDGIPVIIQVFSNGGSFVVERIEKLILQHVIDPNSSSSSSISGEDQADLQLLHTHLISEMFDSCPCYMHLSAGVAGIKEAVPNPIVNNVASFLFLFVVVFVRGWEKLQGKRLSPDEFWHHLSTINIGVPYQSYVYSLEDRINDANKLRELMDIRKEQVIIVAGNNNNNNNNNNNTVEVKSLEFERGPHCQLLRAHPEEYKAFIQSFLDRSIELYKNKMTKATKL